MTSSQRFFLGISLVFSLAASCRSAQHELPRPLTDGMTTSHGMLVVFFAPDSADTFAPIGPDPVVVLNWLRLVCDSAKMQLDVKEYPFGSLIIAIGPRRNGDGGNWLYRVNGRMIAKAASACRVAPTDTVEFFYK